MMEDFNMDNKTMFKLSYGLFVLMPLSVKIEVSAI